MCFFLSSFLKNTSNLQLQFYRVEKIFANSGLLLNISNYNRIIVNMTSTTLDKIEYNFKKADYLLADINQKLADIAYVRNCQSNSAGAGDGNKRLKKDDEYEKLKAEIEKWKELLTVRQIRNGKKFIRYYTTKEAGEGSTSPDDATNEESVDKSAGVEQAKKAEKPAPKKSEGGKPDNDSKSAPPKAKEAKVKAPKEAQPKASGGGAPSAEETVDVSRLDFRVGKIVQVEKHPDADSLYLEKVDVGEPNPRTVVSGLVKHVTIEEMQNRMVVLLCNLKPAKMRGVTSEAMVMCASTPEKVEILIPPAGVVPGDLVDFEGFVRNPDPVLNPKKKIFETLAPDLTTDSNKVATYKGVPFTIKGKGIVTAATLAGVNIK